MESNVAVDLTILPFPPFFSCPFQVAWRRLKQYHEDDVSVEGHVVGTNRGGIIVEMECIRGFCPGSQLGRRVETFEELLDKKMSFKVSLD